MDPSITMAPPCKNDEATTISAAREDPPVSEWQAPQYEEHPAGEEIRRQVEFYFSDENLPKDAHLLMKTGGAENLPVTIKHICGFPRMRRYKPYRSVVESLKKSDFLEVVSDKFIKRRFALTVAPTVAPEEIKVAKADEFGIKKKNKVQENKPWLTKGMLKPTGFEEYFTDAPVTPAVFLEERSLYDKDITFETRIETAIQRYRARRKFHQQTAKAFSRFMNYGGIDSGPKPFGGNDQKDLAEKDAADIAALTAIDFVSQDVATTDEWDVDFEGVAKGFLSCHIMPFLRSVTAQDDVARTTGIMRNFYNYLLYHDVCPEYADQIHAARKICDLANVELFNVVVASEQLPGQFNQAVSTLHGGTMTGVYSDDRSWEGADLTQHTLQDCRDIVKFAFTINGIDQQDQEDSGDGALQTVCKEHTGLEVTEIEMASKEIRIMYAKAKKDKPFLSSLGRLHCRRWSYPNAPKFDHSQEAMKRQQAGATVTLWIEEDILRYCFVGMKIEGEVRELENGLQWLDSIRAINPSFFEYLPNELFYLQKGLRADEEASKKVIERNLKGLDKVDEMATTDTAA